MKNLSRPAPALAGVGILDGVATQINAMLLMTPPDLPEVGGLHEACHLILLLCVAEQSKIFRV